MQDYSTPKSRWTALINRDPNASNAFVYCVTTTKIYCRPNCPSRLARRANIVFHDNSADAVATGFRACMRCRPAMPEDECDPQKIAVAKTCAAIDKELLGAEKKGVRELAKDVGFTESHFCRVFKKITGMTVGEYRASVSGKQTLLSETAEGSREKEKESLSVGQNPGASNTPYDFDFNSLPFPDRRDPAQLEFELESGWYDFSRAPDTYGSSSGLMAAAPCYAGLFDDRFSNAESSIDTTPHLLPLVTMDDGLQFLNLDHHYTHVI
jgi:methylphosphotriester-DNA--protein-cysteine methyltransferase